MYKKPVIGVLGFSDGEPEVHEQVKGIVQTQVNTLVETLYATNDANHCCAVYGDHVEELKMICRMLNVEVELLG
jgi:hypothetical protein